MITCARAIKSICKYPTFNFPVKSYATIALFGDNHFQDRGLKRIVKSSNWIIEEIARRKCDQVICLGDVLNTRELVSVRSLSAALSFFDRLASTLKDIHRLDPCVTEISKSKLHILLGNHDINLKHSRKISSLDALQMDPIKASGITLHREMTVIKDLFPDIDAIMIPYHEDQAEIESFLANHLQSVGPERCSNTLVFGHLAITGATQNNSPYVYQGPLKVSTFTHFSKTFSGHFHHHHQLSYKGKKRIVYVGSPMQFNFGDAGDSRGIVIYDTVNKKLEHVLNPFGEQFVIMKDSDVKSKLLTFFKSKSWNLYAKNLPEGFDDQTTFKFRPNVENDEEDSNDALAIPDNHFKDKFVRVIMTTGDLTDMAFEEVRKDLLKVGVLGVTKHSESIKTLIDAHKYESHMIQSRDQLQPFHHYSTATTADANRLLRDFASSVRNIHLNPSSTDSKKKKTVAQSQSYPFLESEDSFNELVALGVKLVEKSNQLSPDSNISKKTSTFQAKLHSLYLNNFMGIQGELTIPFHEMNSGIWMIEGANGSGKSSIFEALVWVQFGEFLRHGMQKDFAINDNANTCTVRLAYANGLVIERTRKRNRGESLKLYSLHDVEANVRNIEELDPLEALSETTEEVLKLHRRGRPKKKLEKEEMVDIQAGELPSSSISNGTSKKRRNSQMVYHEDAELADIRNTQKQLCERLGVNFETFSKSVVLGQNILSNFVSGNKEQRRAIIEEMLGLDKFNDWLLAARTERAQIDGNIKLETQKHDILKQKLDIILENVTQYELKVLEITKRVDDLKNRILNLTTSQETELGIISNEIKVVREALQQDDIRLIAERVKLEGAEKVAASMNELLNNLTDLSSTIKSTQLHLSSAFETQNSDRSTATCATCGQTVSEEHVRSMILKSLKLLSQTQSLVPSLSNKFDSSKEEEELTAWDVHELLEQALSGIQSYKSSVTLLSRKYNSLELQSSKLETTFAKTKAMQAGELSELSTQLAVETAELKSLLSTASHNSEEVAVLKASLNQISSDIESLKKSYSMTKFWEVSFDKQSKGIAGTIRAFVFEDIIQELNEICNSYVDQLQSKEHTSLRVTLSADLDLEQNYGKRSGGERKRTDLAILFAMFELVRSQSNYLPDFIMLDEVFDALDRDGREMVGQVLQTFSKKLEKILVITHTDVAAGLSISGVLDVKMPHTMLGIPLGTTVQISHR